VGAGSNRNGKLPVKNVATPRAGDERVTDVSRSGDRVRPDNCFPPVVSRGATTLILGSLPGRRSLEVQQYYAHPQNAFWRIIGAVFGVDGSLPYTEKVKILTSRHVALWDVLAAAERPGSLDSAIVSASALANEFAEFFRAHPRIRRVFFNGRKAEQLYARLVLPRLGLEFPDMQYRCLPSTSPAHAGMTFAEKLARWKAIKE
jgi:hypoxanthine-DNA glycosylase